MIQIALCLLAITAVDFCGYLLGVRFYSNNEWAIYALGSLSGMLFVLLVKISIDWYAAGKRKGGKE